MNPSPFFMPLKKATSHITSADTTSAASNIYMVYCVVSSCRPPSNLIGPFEQKKKVREHDLHWSTFFAPVFSRQHGYLQNPLPLCVADVRLLGQAANKALGHNLVFLGRFGLNHC